MELLYTTTVEKRGVPFLDTYLLRFFFMWVFLY